MPKLILRCNYLKHAPAAHLQNYMKYIATREGVEKIKNSMPQLPATTNQKVLIRDILSKIEDAGKLHEYYDYLQKPTRENASEFITRALENNLDIIAKKKNYMDYLANRPRVEKVGTHGLFSNEGESVILSQVADEVANHKGVIWTNVVSLRREDAERLGYNSASQWQELVRSRIQTFAENYKIDSRNLKWYAAFHDESHHPHIHLVIYSSNPSEGHLSKTGIENIRSALAHDIFRQDFMSIYERKTEQRNQLKQQAEHSLLFLLKQMRKGVCQNETIMEQMEQLSNRLKNTGGKKVYGYLKADVKAIVNRIVDELATEPLVSECYEKWLESNEDILRTYKDRMPERLPLSMQKELKSIKNMVITEAVKLGNGHFWFDDERSDFIEAEHINPHDELSDEVELLGEEQFENLSSHEDDESMTAHDSFYADWTDRYKEARECLYGTEDTGPDLEAAYEIMMEEAMNGNAFALFDIGRMYQKGTGVGRSQEQAEDWYKKALTAFVSTENKSAKAYIEYRIGKHHQYGLGTEQNSREAAGWYEKSIARSQHLQKSGSLPYYALGILHYQGDGVEQSYAKAKHLFMEAHTRGNAYASFELAKMYEKGIGTERNPELAEDCYRIAFLGFRKMEQKSKDDNLYYRIGCMYSDGRGTEPDEGKAEQ